MSWLVRACASMLLGLALLAACQAAPESVPTLTLEPTRTPAPLAASPTPLPSATAAVLLPTSLPTQTPEPENRFCSPIQGVELEQIPALVTNPFHPPAPGSDDPHQGVDLADRLEGSQVSLAGRAVMAIQNGKVAALIRDRFPYGNALMLESTLDELPEAWSALFSQATAAPGFQPDPALTCPDVLKMEWKQDVRSLYVLYAHMQAAPSLKLDDPVTCGQVIGAIGESGNALNPHLHLEVRLGPAGARFDSLAHYDNRATLEEMDAYCTWRVRGIFQLVDPLSLLAPTP